MTAKEKLMRAYVEIHNLQVICIDKAGYGDCITVAKRDKGYFLLMTDVLGKEIICIRHFSNWRDAKRAYTAIAYEP